MKIVVLAGGTSTERDVSLISGSNIYRALKRKGHDVILVDLYLGYEGGLPIDETIFKMSKNLFQIRDTARFQNNWQENSITITRGVKDTTVEMGGIVNQSYVYGRLSYDLRDSSWCLDSLVHYYKKSDLPFSVCPWGMSRDTDWRYNSLIPGYSL